MGRQTIVYGRITLRGNRDDFNAVRAFISTLKKDNTYPAIRTEMFSFGAKIPYYEYEPVIAFAANYNGVEDDITTFIIKFEHILRNIPFDNVKLELDTEATGTYNFYWATKTEYDRYTEDDKLIETDEWYFGEGYRNRYGNLFNYSEEDKLSDLGFEYPIQLDPDLLENFNAYAYKNHDVTMSKQLAIIVNYAVNTGTKYGYAGEKGYWVQKT
jgi:hypothetical protein